jgi:hypothetical protein
MHCLDQCWGHHQEGSDLLVNEHVLFDIVFNTAIRNMQKSVKKIDEIIGESCKNIKSCCSCDSPHGDDCEKSQSSYWQARKFIEDKIEIHKQIFGSKAP